MNFTFPNFALALPEIFILAMASIILVTSVFIKFEKINITYVLTQTTLLATFFIVLNQYTQYPTTLLTFDNHYILDKLSLLTKLAILTITFFTFIYTHSYIKQRNIPQNEYYILGLFATLGMMVMASAYSLLTIYLGLELLSLPLYAMVAMDRDSETAGEAAMKYFTMGAFASGLLLYGISLVYGATGSIQMTDMTHVLSAAAQPQTVVLTAGLIFIVAGLIFKFGAVPFHSWVPDVYHGAPSSVTLLIASAPKIAAIAITFRILATVFPEYQIAWQQLLIVIAVLSMFFGNLLAIVQSNLKRMLAYSSIAHIGYMLLGLIAGTAEGYSAAMFYIIAYVIMAAGAFGMITILSSSGIEFDKLDDFRGLNARNPWLALMMLLLMFSMAGVPPTVGFFAKLSLLQALVNAHFVWLAIAALVAAIIGAYYYLRVVMLMYFEEPSQSVVDTQIAITPTTWVAITLNGSAALVLGVLPGVLINVCKIII